MEILNIDISTNKWVKFNGNFNVCSEFWDTELSDIEVIEVIERIGSESSQGEVYRIQFSGIEAAGKILPILSDESLEKNKNELEIAAMLSDKVINENIPYFPLVYGFSYCKNTKYNERSLFLEDSYKYSLFNTLCSENNWSSACKKRMIQKYKSFSKAELEKEFNNTHVELPSHVLISSLARSDLREITKHYRLEHDSWIYIILEVIKGLIFLNEKMKIIHNDLHCGNILINFDSNEILQIPIIHDFGKSKILKEWSMYDKITDIGIFLSDLLLNPDVTPTVKDKIQIAMDYINEIKFSKISDNFSVLSNIQELFYTFQPELEHCYPERII